MDARCFTRDRAEALRSASGRLTARLPAADNRSAGEVAERKLRLDGRRVTYLESRADSGVRSWCCCTAWPVAGGTWRRILAMLGRLRHSAALLGPGQSAEACRGGQPATAVLPGRPRLLARRDHPLNFLHPNALDTVVLPLYTPL